METQAKTASYGRPRLLNHDEILDGAVELGLETLTMKRLATHLGVGTATLYQYFDSRKALMRAAASHSLSGVSLPEDTGQHWSILARDYVKSLLVLFSDNPTYITSINPTDYGFEVHFKLIEPFLTSMKQRGIAPKDGMRLFNMIGLIGYGTAIEASRQREFEFHDETMEVVARRQFSRLDVSEFPMMSEALSEFTLTDEEKMDSLIDAAFRTFARDIGQDENQLFNEAT